LNGNNFNVTNSVTPVIGKNKCNSKGIEGIIDQVRIFNRALTEDEVKKIYVEDSQYIFKKHLRANLITKGDTYTVTPYEYRFEGQYIADILIKKESSVISFELASSVNKDYTVRLYYPDGTLYDSKTITYDGDKEFQKHSVVFDFSNIDLTKVNLDENLGLVLTIGENDEINEGDYLRLINVQFEKGSVATEFEVVPYESQLNRCLRYYEVAKYGLQERVANATERKSTYVKIKQKRIIPNNRIILTYTNEDETNGITDVSKRGFVYWHDCARNGTAYIHVTSELDAELPGRGE
jgi:hypothetical protein